MYTATFTFARREFDDAFHALDGAVAEAARAIPGYQVVIGQVLGARSDGGVAHPLKGVTLTDVARAAPPLTAAP